MASKMRERLLEHLSPEARREQLERLNQATERGPLRTVRVAFESFDRHNALLWASGLTYTTSLSLVPILAVALSAVKGFGGEDLIRPLIARIATSPDIGDRLLGFVANISAKTVGAVGGATLLVTVILTLGTVERAFNHIFNVPRGRTWIRRFTDYLSLVFTMPLLLVAAASLRSNLQSHLIHLKILGSIAATLPVWAGFTFLYLIFPNTRVRWGCAALGGLIAAILLETGQWGYVHFQVGVARSQTIYGALAAIPIFLTWIYMAWVIVLAGAEVAAAAQGVEPPLDADYRSANFTRMAALLAVIRAAEGMRVAKSAACTARALANELGVPEVAVRPVLERLSQAGIVHEVAPATPSDTADRTIMLSRDSGAIPIAEVLSSLEDSPQHTKPALAAVLADLHKAECGAIASLTVADLAAGEALLVERDRA